MNLAGSVYNKDFDTAANTIAKSLNAKVGSYTDENYESSVGRTYDQNSNRLSIMGVAMSSMILESFKRDTSKCGLVAFHMSRYINGSTVPVVSAAQAKAAYDSLYKQLKAKYGEPTNTIEKTESGTDKSDYSKYYWVQWNTPEGNVWLCWGKDLWNQQGYNDCILSVSHCDQSKQ